MPVNIALQLTKTQKIQVFLKKEFCDTIKFRMIAIFLKISKLFVTIGLIKLFYKHINEDY